MMNIKDKFLELTSRTYPHGTETEMFHLLCDGLVTDEFGNLFIKIGNSDVMFTSHLDTATSALTTVNHVFEDNIIKTDGKSILGADDKAGVTVMLYMIEKRVPGLYYFFLGEEVGCVGSKKVAAVQKEVKIEGINKVVSFDRRGNSSVITYQSSKRCASDAFGKALAAELNKADEAFKYDIDPTGVLTDSVQFISIYPECTNISVGYRSEHTFSESQDIEHLEKLAVAATKVDWASLPVERDPSKVEYRSYGGYYGGGYYDDYYDDYAYGYGSRYSHGNYSYNRPNYNTPSETERTEITWFEDRKYNYISNVEVKVKSGEYVKVDLYSERIRDEKQIIEELLTSLEIDYSLTTWDGMELTVVYKKEQGGHTTKSNRNELIEYLPELDYAKIDELESNPNSEYAKYLEDIYE